MASEVYRFNMLQRVDLQTPKQRFRKETAIASLKAQNKYLHSSSNIIPEIAEDIRCMKNEPSLLLLSNKHKIQ